MTFERYGDSPFEEGPSTYQVIALRVGSPNDWERPEYAFEVSKRLHETLGYDEQSEEIRLAAIAESDRQIGLIKKRSEIAQNRLDKEYASQMGSVAIQLVDTLIPADDPRDRDQLVDGVLKALRPLYDRIEQTD